MEKFMALTFIKRSSLPVATKGKAATEPKITISDKGQLTLNPVATAFLKGNGKVGLGFDKDTGTVYFIRHDHKSVEKLGDEDLLHFKAPKVKDGKKGKGNILSLSFGTALQAGLDPSHKYNYKDSGSQTFEMKTDEKNKMLSFVLPNGSLTKRPVVTRKRKQKTTTTTAPASTQQVNGAANTATVPPTVPETESELTIE